MCCHLENCDVELKYLKTSLLFRQPRMANF